MVAATRWRDRGYAVSQSAVAKHRQRFIQEFTGVRRAEMAAALADAARRAGRAGGGVDAGRGRRWRAFEQLLMERLLATEELNAAGLSPRDLSEFAKSVTAAVGSRGRLEVIRREFDETRRARREGGKAAKRRPARRSPSAWKEILGV